MVYEKQKIEKAVRESEKEKDALLVKLYKLQDQHAVSDKAADNLGMQQLKLSQTITFTEF